MDNYIDRLRRYRKLRPEEYRALLVCDNPETVRELHEAAREQTLSVFGNRIYIRGLIEFSNICRNDCLYCGIRRSNRRIGRYTLSRDEILECCRKGYALGFRTFVLQGGEESEAADEAMAELIKRIREEFADAAITLSLGEKPAESYERFFRAGANRYLLRHETHNPEHYRTLHPQSMSLAHRLRCLDDLKRIGFQTGTGIMVGSPGQTVNHLIEDILFIEKFRPEMIGIGPFIPHCDTPFAASPPGSLLLRRSPALPPASQARSALPAARDIPPGPLPGPGIPGIQRSSPVCALLAFPSGYNKVPLIS